jgi:hypothetical protein
MATGTFKTMIIISITERASRVLLHILLAQQSTLKLMRQKRLQLRFIPNSQFYYSYCVTRETIMPIPYSHPIPLTDP